MTWDLVYQYSIYGVYLFSAFCIQNAVGENIEDMPLFWKNFKFHLLWNNQMAHVHININILNAYFNKAGFCDS